MDRITALRYFLRVADAGSFTRAAAQMDVSLATVSRAIEFLEHELGSPLFVRTTRMVSLTTEGKVMRPKALELLKISESLYSDVRATAGLQPEGRLRVSSSIVIGWVFMQHVILNFRRRNPGVQVELFTVDGNVDLARTGIDIAFKVGSDLPENAVARRIGSVRSIMAASPSYLASHGAPQQPSDLVQHNCIINSYFGNVTRLWDSAGGSVVVDVKGGFSCNNTLICSEMCIAGQGIAMMPRDLAARFVKAGTLVHVLPGWEGEPYGFYALTATRYLSGIGRLFLDEVEESLKGVDGRVYAAFSPTVRGKEILGRKIPPLQAES